MKPDELFHLTPQGTDRVVVKRVKADAEPYDSRLHDVKNALRAFDTIVGSLKQGYKLDDANAPLYIARLESALAELKAESQLWQKLYETP